MSLVPRHPKKVQSDINRLEAQKKVVLNDPIYNEMEKQRLINTYDHQLAKLAIELQDANDHLDLLNGLNVFEAVEVKPNPHNHVKQKACGAN